MTLVVIWWNDATEDASDDAMRLICEAVQALDMRQVNGVIAQPLSYFVRAVLDGDNPEDLTWGEMLDSVGNACWLLRGKLA